jgi:hypothetical protein
MSVYRITEFTSSDMDKAGEFGETLREVIAGAGADFIDIVSLGDGKGLVVAKYATQATMEAASEVAKQAFGKMIEAGVVNGDSIGVQTGEVVISY